jgi:hypothetical protein
MTLLSALLELLLPIVVREGTIQNISFFHDYLLRPALPLSFGRFSMAYDYSMMLSRFTPAIGDRW